MTTLQLKSYPFRHFPIVACDVAALLFLFVNEERFLFQVLSVSQLILGILLLAVHRQSKRQLTTGREWSRGIIISQLVLLLVFCAFLFFIDLNWSFTSSWQRPARLLVGRASEVTTMLGVCIGAMAVVGCLLLRKKGT